MPRCVGSAGRIATAAIGVAFLLHAADPVAERVAVVGGNCPRIIEDVAGQVRTFTTGQLGELGVFRPDLVVVPAESGKVWRGISPTVLKEVFGRDKVVGLGRGGCELYVMLGSDLGGVMLMPSDFAVHLVNFPTGIIAPPTLPETFLLHDGIQSYVAGVWDRGDPARDGFEGIARWRQRRNHWPVARQGNLLLWGADAPLSTLTEDGRRLFLALLRDHVRRPFVSFEEARPPKTFWPAGPIEDSLTPTALDNLYYFRPKRPGTIRAVLSWARPERLSLVLNGPGQVVGWYARYGREDGASPLRIEFQVTPELVKQGDVPWRFSVTHYGGFAGRIDYRLDLDFPD